MRFMIIAALTLPVVFGAGAAFNANDAQSDFGLKI